MVTHKKIEQSNLPKILKTVRGSIKKAIFYLGADIPYNITTLLISPLDISLSDIKRQHPAVYNLILMDYWIRKTDDLLDEILYRRSPLPVMNIRKEIDKFTKISPDFKEVAELFSLELEFNSVKIVDIKSMLSRIIEIRPCDYFLLTDQIIKFFGSKLSKNDLNNSQLFFREFQKLRDLLDDIMSTEEDNIKNSYNNVLVAEKYGLSYQFFYGIISDKFKRMEDFTKLIQSKKHKRLLKSTIIFWKKQYIILFKPLLIKYFTDKNRYKEIYFMFKQV